MTTQARTSPEPRTAHFSDRVSSLAFPLVRITTGLLLIPHGAQKLFGWFGGYGLWGLLAVAIILRGGGRFSLDPRIALGR